jgi:hypothetical protein
LSLSLWKEHRLKVFQNRVLRRTFGPKRQEAAGGWRRLHSEELRNLYASPNIVRMVNQIKEHEMGGACRTDGRDEKYIQYFGWKT